MSRQQQDADTQSRPRQRANTTSFPSFAQWRRPRSEHPSPSPAPVPPIIQPPLPMEALIEALTPPAVPSLSHARSLASILSTYSPLPRRASLNLVLGSLCDNDSPVSIQAAGYEILSAYCENTESLAPATADRLSYFSLFLGSKTLWGMELWEPRFKALRALTRYGVDIVGIEEPLIKILKGWIEGAFDGLLRVDLTLERSERAERERSIDVLVKFMAEIINKPENIARITDEILADAMQFYATLVDRSIPLAVESTLQDRVLATLTEVPTEKSIPPKSSVLSHRRNPSSVSLSSQSLTPPSSLPQSPPKTPLKHPAEIAISLYLDHLSSQIKALSSVHLNTVLPILFRALAFCASPLPRLTVLPRPVRKASLEEKIAEMLNSMFAGPYSTTCMLVLKHYLFPPNAASQSEAATSSHGLSQDAYPVSLLSWDLAQTAIMTSLGAHRTLRNYVRRALSTRLARAYISRETTVGYSHTGAPSHMEMEIDLMEKAWPKEDFTSSSTIGITGNGWDAGRLGRVLASSIEAWVAWAAPEGVADLENEKQRGWEKSREGMEKILEEAAGVLKDILQELDAREDDTAGLDEEEADAVGETLMKLAGYILPLRSQDGSPFMIPLFHPTTAPTPLLRTITSLLSRDHVTALNPLLSNILISLAEHLNDADTARLPLLMMDQHDLSPTSPDWLENWGSLLRNPTIVSVQRPLTRHSVMSTLNFVYDSVKDMKSYRQPLADMVMSFCARSINGDEKGDGEDILWRILADEVVLRTVEQESSELDSEDISQYMELLLAVACDGATDDEEDVVDTDSVLTVETHSPSSSLPHTGLSSTPSTATSPILSRMQSDYHSPTREKDKESSLPSVMSILSSLATGGNTSRAQSLHPVLVDAHLEGSESPPTQENHIVPRAVAAVSALVSILSQLAFTPFALDLKNVHLAVQVYRNLLIVLTDGKSAQARLTALQFLARLRADRTHRVYFVGAGWDSDGLVNTLASLINRVVDPSAPPQNESAEETPGDTFESRKARSRIPQERDGRQPSRGRGGGPSRSAASRSRSRTTAYGVPLTPASKPRPTLWRIPDALPFTVVDMDSPSENLVSYYPDGPDIGMVLPVSQYLEVIIDIIEKEKNWEILSYLLCHLPVQLSNKHLFCGPKSRQAISKMLSVLCTGILSPEATFHVDRWPIGLKIRDAEGLAYHTLSVLVSYRRCFDLQQRHLLVEVFQAGLNGHLSTIKCCLHALSLSAFELPSSMTKCLSRILEKLSQIMSNPNMAVHILGFLSIIGSLPSLYANFTESDFKMVFGVALQYLQHYNRLNASPTISWALSQHVRVLSYYVVYVWFLAVKLPDRPGHVPYITRQLLLANEGSEELDSPTEVCFDWLSRYTYGSADPRPATSTFSDIVMNPTGEGKSDGVSEKTWIMGNSVITVKTLARFGWVEVLSRRPSGYCKFLCRVENVPMVGPGDVAPDLVSVPAGLIMERKPSTVVQMASDESCEQTPDLQHDEEQSSSSVLATTHDPESEPPVPDPITGYVWSGTAPSQRRKHVDIDPSFLFLQLSPYPDGINAPYVKIVVDSPSLRKFFSSLDRMPVIDTHKVGIMYVAPGQSNEVDILRNTHGSPAYTRFLEGIGRLINLRGQVDVYAGGLDPDEDGEYAYAWWDDIGQILYHTATMMPTNADDPQCNSKKRHIGNDYVRIVWNDSGIPYQFDTLTTQFQFVNIVIEPHSLGAIAGFSNNFHENEYFKVTVQRAPGMTEFAPVGPFKLISAENLPLLVRQLSLLADLFASVFAHTQKDTVRVEIKTNWHTRLEAIRRFRSQLPVRETSEVNDGIMGQGDFRDFTTSF